MIFLSLRNNRKLSHSWWENIRKALFGAIIAGSALLMIFALDIHHDKYGGAITITKYDIHHLTTLISSMTLMPLTMFVLLAMNKHQYVKIGYKFLFEGIYMTACLALASVFYLRFLSILMVQIAYLVTSVLIMAIAFIFGITRINYKANSMYGPVLVKPISFDSKWKYALVSLYMLISISLQAGNILYFKFISDTMQNYLVYQFILIVGGIIFFLVAVGIFTQSRSLGASQEVLYYRYAQLMILTLIFVAIGLGIYKIFIPVVSTRELIDNIFIGVNFIPMIALFVDLWINKRRLDKDPNYQGFTELRLLIKVLAAVMVILINMIIAIEVKFFINGEVQSNIDVTILSIIFILIMIAVPFFAFWKKVTKRSSRIITTLLFLLVGFMIYKFYFYADMQNQGSTIFGIPVDSIYTMVTLLAVLSVQVVTIVFQARNSGVAFKRYGHNNTKAVDHE